MVGAQRPIQKRQLDGAKSGVPRNHAGAVFLLRPLRHDALKIFQSFPAGRERLGENLRRHSVLNVRHHGCRRLAGYVGAGQALAVAAPAVGASDFDDHRVALFAALQRMAKDLMKRDAELIDRDRFDAPRFCRLGFAVRSPPRRRGKIVAHEQVVAKSERGDVVEEIIRDFVKSQIIPHHAHAFLGVADIDLGMQLEPAQRRLGEAVQIHEGSGDLARTARQHEFEAHGFEQHRQAKLAQGGDRHARRAKSSDPPAGVDNQLVDLALVEAQPTRHFQEQGGMRLLALRTHLFQEILFQKRGGSRQEARRSTARRCATTGNGCEKRCR